VKSFETVDSRFSEFSLSPRTVSMTDPRIEIVQRFFSGTGPTYDFLVNLNTFGFDALWKRRILEKIPEGSTRIMDQGCGTGILTLQIARRFPHCRVTGVELRDEYLNIAREKVQALKFSNVEFVLGKAEDVYLEDKFDCITSSYLAKYAELEVLTRNIKRMLRNGGMLVIHDFTYPRNRPFAKIWEFYFKLLQIIGEWKYPQWREIYHGLPKLLRETRWVPELIKILPEMGFSDVQIQYFTLGTSAIITARKGYPQAVFRVLG
jgi:demethylmenaquinone methyltransferase / 2-methoxy-6-polyprenyl-1,4-benzoquinol methylase